MADRSLNRKWKVVKSVAGGVEGATPQGTFLHIDGDNFDRVTPTYTFTRKLVVNTTTIPHQVDLHITNEPDMGQIFLGIYKVVEGMLYLAHALPGSERPVNFESTTENHQILSVSKKL